MSTLALNQGKPAVVIEILKGMDAYFVTDQIRLLALADLGYINETIESLSIWIDNGTLSEKKISIDVVGGLKPIFYVEYDEATHLIFAD